MVAAKSVQHLISLRNSQIVYKRVYVRLIVAAQAASIEIRAFLPLLLK